MERVFEFLLRYVAEGRNRDAKDIKDFSKGCVDFFRYRKRIMLVINRHRDDE